MAVKITAKIEGLDKLRKKMLRLGPAGDAAVRTAIYKVAHEVMEESIRMTPLDDGWLRNTWYITKPYKAVGFSELGYGADYAHILHEGPANRNWSEPGTGNKFLEKPFNARRTRMANDIAKIAKAKFSQNVTTANLMGSSVPDKPATGPKPSSWRNKGGGK